MDARQEAIERARQAFPGVDGFPRFVIVKDADEPVIVDRALGLVVDFVDQVGLTRDGAWFHVGSVAVVVKEEASQ